MSKPTKKKKKTNWLLIGLLALLAVVLIAAFFKGKGKESGTAVTFDEVVKRSINETVSASGKIFPETEVKISSDVSGEIVNLYVEEGDSVVQGQVLAKIDPDAFASAVERGRASVNTSKAQKAMAESNIASSQAQLSQIKAQLQNAQRIHDRNKVLMADGVISQAEFDQSESNLNGLLANLEAAKASIESAEKNAESAAYNVKVSQANLKELTTNLNRTTIKAPTSGTVSSLSVEKGERVVGTIQMTGTEMMRIANLNTMEVQVEVSENDILRVNLGDEVDIEVDAYLDKVFKGVVTEIANSANNISTTGRVSLNTDQVTNFVVKIRIDPTSYTDISGNGEYAFRPGMSASVDIYTDRQNGIVTVPIQAVTVRDMNEINDVEDATEEDIQEVVFVHEGDTVRLVQVTTGIQDDEYIHVSKGLSEGMEVVSGPYSAVSKRLKPGSNVREKKKKKDSEK